MSFSFKKYLLEEKSIKIAEHVFESVSDYYTLLEDTPEQARQIVSFVRKGDTKWAPNKGTSIKHGAEYHDEMVEHAKEFGAMTPEQRKNRANEAAKELEESHGIKGHNDILKSNGKLETRSAGSEDPVRVPHDHPIHGKQHGGKPIIAKGIQDSPDSIKTSAGEVARCSNSTAACRSDCLMKHGQNAIPAAKDAKARCTYATIGTDKEGREQSEEKAKSTRRNYVHLLLHGMSKHIDSAEKQGAAPAIRPGFASDAHERLAPELAEHGLPEKHHKIIWTGYSGQKDQHNKYPGYAASIKGPAFKEKIDHVTGEKKTEYSDKNVEAHQHLHKMLSSLHTNSSSPTTKNGYAVIGGLRSKNPRFVSKEEQKKMSDTIASIHTIRHHHYDEHGNHVGHTDYDVRDGTHEGDVRATDMPNNGKNSTSPSGKKKGAIMINTISGVPKGKTTKSVEVENHDDPAHPYKVPGHAHNSDFTFPVSGARGGVLHIHHPHEVAKLSNAQRKRFGENDKMFRENNNMTVENKD